MGGKATKQKQKKMNKENQESVAIKNKKILKTNRQTKDKGDRK